MDSQTLVLYGGIAILVLVPGLYLLFWFREKRKMKELMQKQGGNTLNLRLQAYERLVLQILGVVPCDHRAHSD